MKKYMLILWLLVAVIPSVAFAADAVESGKDASAVVSTNSDKEVKTHKKTANKNWVKAKTVKAEKEKSK